MGESSSQHIALDVEPGQESGSHEPTASPAWKTPGAWLGQEWAVPVASGTEARDGSFK